MSIISVEIIKQQIKENGKKTAKEKQTKAERSKESRSYTESVRGKWFCCASKLGFFSLICKASLSLKSNLDLALSIKPFLIDKVIKKYLEYKFSSNQTQLKDKFDVHYFKFPYIGNILHHIKNKLSKLCKEFCKEIFNIKLVFSWVKIKNYFS